ncbi:MAG: SCO family protein [Caldilineales bacterium]|nr:SCO family protein [Caldilineales bacterium]
MNKKFVLPLALGVVIIILLAGFFFLLPRLRPHTFHGTILQPSEPIDFTLTGMDGQPVSLSDFRGKYVVLYFGYTFCPDVCPLTLAELGKAVRILEDKGEKVQVLMVTVDPQRDTPERLAQYVPAFHPSFIGLTGSEDDIAQVAAPMGIFYARNEVGGASGYLMDHTASITLLDDQGRMRLVWPYGVSGDLIADDLDYLIR